MADLKLIYKAATFDEAEYQLLSFEEKWNKKYPQIAKSWRGNWTELSAYFKYPEEVRRIIYTTNAVEEIPQECSAKSPRQRPATRLMNR